jgi:hypothetical protein
MKALHELLETRRKELKRDISTPSEPWESKAARAYRKSFVCFLEGFSVAPRRLEVDLEIENVGHPARKFRFIIKDLGSFGFGVHAYECGPLSGRMELSELTADQWLHRDFKLVSESWVGSFTGSRWARAEDHGLQCFDDLETAAKAVRVASIVIALQRNN